MSGQLPSDLLTRLTSAIESLTEVGRAQAAATERATERAERSQPGPAADAGGGFGGFLGNALAGAGGLPGALGAASQLVNPASPAGQALGGAANIASGAAAGFAAGGPVGAAVGGGLAAVQSLQQAGAAELAYEAQQIRLSDPSLNPVQADLERRQLEINRDPTTTARSFARGLQGPLGAAVSPLGYLLGAGERFEAALGPDPQLQLEQDRIAQAPQARALARLQAEAGQIARFGGELSDDMLAIMSRNFLQQEERFQASQERIKAFFGESGDRKGTDR